MIMKSIYDNTQDQQSSNLCEVWNSATSENNYQDYNS